MRVNSDEDECFDECSQLMMYEEEPPTKVALGKVDTLEAADSKHEVMQKDCVKEHEIPMSAIPVFIMWEEREEKGMNTVRCEVCKITEKTIEIGQILRIMCIIASGSEINHYQFDVRNTVKFVSFHSVTVRKFKLYYDPTGKSFICIYMNMFSIMRVQPPSINSRTRSGDLQEQERWKQRAVTSYTSGLHPHITCWGSLLRLYGKGSCKTIKEKKQEEQEITELQNKHVPTNQISVFWQN
ncbi:hypothetical protein GQR58_026527 [Nymphon striatum]|nr:hypothetical protein GQR58_026527 [Nymphon striatum]